MKQLRFPPPWGPRVVDILAKIADERDKGIKTNYHFCDRKI